ncbi:MAG: pyridoxal phosphate-dependent aminotransferase [Verrucomicrobiota bacterium]|nr:pyridoxal phosphate-dependent aminotransferase [Verrucomicrobiota bacterium]
MGKRNLLNPRIAGIPPSETLGIAALAKKLAAEGRKVCDFSAGEPDFDTPDHIKESAVNALKNGKTKYTPAAGLPELRSAIAKKLKKDNDLTYEPRQIVVSNGAKHSLFNVILTICREGDEVIIPGPWWLSYPEMVKIAGARPVYVYAPESKGFKPESGDFERAVTSRTKAIILNSPCNPSGIVYTRDELKAIAAIAVRHDLFVVADEIYESLVYDGATHVSLASFGRKIYDRTITVNGFSKAWSMTGWRMGYLAAAPAVADAVTAFQSHSTSAPNTFAQYGAVAAIEGTGSDVAGMVSAFAERRAVMYRRLTSIEGITCVKPMGAFYMFPNVSGFGISAAEFAKRLLEQQAVAVVPGGAFGGEGNIRLSYACGMDDIREGMDRLEKFVKSL